MTDLKEVEVEHEGQNLKLNQGMLKITFDGYVVSDRKGKWSGKPTHWLLSILMEKYFYRNHLAKFETWMKADIEDLMYKIKSFLNVYKNVKV